MQDICREVLRNHTVKDVGVLAGRLVLLCSKLDRFVEDNPQIAAKFAVNSHDSKTQWINEHPAVRLMAMYIANLSCPKRDCSYYQTENIVKDLAGIS